MYYNRTAEQIVNKLVKSFKVVMVTGPRQVGKSTMLRHMFDKEYTYITFDDINEVELAREDPKLFFLNHPGKLIIDEVQYVPEIFREIKRIVDSSGDYGRFILTGSQSYSLMSNVTESLAGRVGIIELNGFSTREIIGDDYPMAFIPNNEFLNAARKPLEIERLWDIIHRGSMPELYRNPDIDWQLYYASYLKTYIERDVRTIINVKDLSLFSKFIVSLAARTAQLINYAVLANELGIDAKTTKRWIGILENSGIIKLVQPFSNNRLTRAIKTPMLYFMDTGLVAYLLKWNTKETLMNGAMSGHILETYVISEVIKSFNNNGNLNPPVMFYRDKDMNEIDLILEDNGILYPVEIKKTTRPKAAMGKHLKLLNKAEGYEVGEQLILSLVDKKTHVSEDIIAYPITQI